MIDILSLLCLLECWHLRFQNKLKFKTKRSEYFVAPSLSEESLTVLRREEGSERLPFNCHKKVSLFTNFCNFSQNFLFRALLDQFVFARRQPLFTRQLVIIGLCVSSLRAPSGADESFLFHLLLALSAERRGKT